MARLGEFHRIPREINGIVDATVEISLRRSLSRHRGLSFRLCL